jgi:hypothetical protein
MNALRGRSEMISFHAASSQTSPLGNIAETPHLCQEQIIFEFWLLFVLFFIFNKNSHLELSTRQ